MKNLMSTKHLLLLFVALVVAAVPATHVFAKGNPGDPPPGSTFEQRVAQRKAEQPSQLDEPTVRRLQSQCANAQSQIRKLQADARTISENRSKVYKHIDGKLWYAVGKLKLADKDTFKLEQAKASWIQKVILFQNTLGNYQQTLDDALVINCRADVVGFRALVDTIQLYHSELIDQSADVKKATIDDVQSEINDIISEMDK